MNLRNLIPWGGELTAWNPVENMRSMVETMDRALGSPLKGLRQSLRGVTLTETPKEVLITADISGMEKEDIEVDVGEDAVAIRAHRKRVRAHGRAEAGYYRAISLPCAVKPKDAKAIFEGGILRVELPKVKETYMRRVTVE